MNARRLHWAHDPRRPYREPALPKETLKKISLVGISAALALVAFVPAASAADLNAPNVKWSGPTYQRNLPATPKRNTGEVSVRFWNSRTTGDLKLGRLVAKVPYECTGNERRFGEFEYDEREDKGPDDAKVWVENDFGIKMIHFKLTVDRINAGGKFVFVTGAVKYPASASNDQEPDASGRIASYMKDCRSVGGVGFPLGWRGDRTELKPAAN